MVSTTSTEVHPRITAIHAETIDAISVSAITHVTGGTDVSKGHARTGRCPRGLPWTDVECHRLGAAFMSCTRPGDGLSARSPQCHGVYSRWDSRFVCYPGSSASSDLFQLAGTLLMNICHGIVVDKAARLKPESTCSCEGPIRLVTARQDVKASKPEAFRGFPELKP